MGWLKSRFGEASTLAGVGVIFNVLMVVAPEYSNVWAALASACGVGAFVRKG